MSTAPSWTQSESHIEYNALASAPPVLKKLWCHFKVDPLSPIFPRILYFRTSLPPIAKQD